MKLFFWKDNYRIDSFAKQLADDFFSQVPPAAATAYCQGGEPAASTAAGKNKAGKRAAPNKQPGIERSLHDVALKLAQFKAQEKLGIYGKARVHLSFMERLGELGFDQATAQQLNRMLLLKAP